MFCCPTASWTPPPFQDDANRARLGKPSPCRAGGDFALRSRQIRAATLSTANLQAARWWPLESNGRPHQQLRPVGEGKAKTEGEGHATNTAPDG